MKKNRKNVYKTTNLLNGKIYVGQSIYDDPTYFGSGDLIGPLVRDLGKENFKKKILQDCSSQRELDDRETYWIDKLHATDPEIGYNIAKGGNNPPTNAQTPEMRKKQSEWMKGRFCGEDNWMFGKRGELSPNYGGSSPNAKECIINGIRYSAIIVASRELNIGYGIICYRLETGKEGYFYADETEEDRRARRRANIKKPRGRAVIIDDIYYSSIASASRELGKSASTLADWIHKGKPGYSFADETEEDREARRKVSIAHKRNNRGEKNGMFGKRGELSPNAKAVIAEWKTFPAIIIASKELSIPRDIISYRIRTGKPGYSYCDKEEK